MSENLDYTPDLYTLVDEDGNEQMFELLDALEENDERYFALVPYIADPTEALQDDGDLVILKAQLDENGEEIMATIDDDDEFDRIGGIFMQRIMEMFDDEEGCGCGCGNDDCHCESDGESCSCGSDCNCGEN